MGSRRGEPRVWYPRNHPFADGRLSRALALPAAAAEPVRGSYWFQHGRQGVRFLPEALVEERRRPLLVGVPAFTCHVLVDAVRTAGAIAIPIDVDPATFMLTVERLPSEGLDVLIVGHLFGMRCPDSERIAGWASQRGVIVVDDFAQYLGADAADLFGASPGAVAAIHSFGPDKPLAALRGGLLTTNDAGFVDRFAARYASLPEETDLEAVADLRELQALATRSLPSTGHPASVFTRVQAALIEVEWLRTAAMHTLPAVRGRRPGAAAPIRLSARKISYLRSLAETYEELRLSRERACILARDWLVTNPGVQVPAVPLVDYGGVRWSVRIAPGRRRRQLRRLLRQKGIEAGRFNWVSAPWCLSDLRGCPGAVECYRDVLNVPTWGVEIWESTDSVSLAS